MDMGRKAISLVCVLLSCAACSEKLVIRSSPPGAEVYLDGKAAGTTPLTYETRDVHSMPFRVERSGSAPVEGQVEARIAGGRLAGAILTLGILAACRPLRYFSPNPIDVDFGTTAASLATLRLYNVKNATVLEGECDEGTASCWIDLPSGERCPGDYVRETQGSTTTTKSAHTMSGSGVGVSSGGGIGSVGFQATNATGAVGTEVPNTTHGVAVLRCHETIIDCTMTLDTFQKKGHGECTDSAGHSFRLTLLPKNR